MTLPSLGKAGKRDRAVAMRLTEDTVEKLKKLAKAHNLSQADVVTLLVEQEYKQLKQEKARKG